MTLEDYNTYCDGLGQTTHVVQWGGSHVWKIGGKVFAMGTPDGDHLAACTFKVRPISFYILKEQPGCQGAPYLASRGIQGNRMRIVSYGKERPVAVCNDISCWSQNRRSVTVLDGAGGGV